MKTVLTILVCVWLCLALWYFFLGDAILNPGIARSEVKKLRDYENKNRELRLIAERLELNIKIIRYNDILKKSEKPKE